MLNLLDIASQYAYWTGRLSADLEELVAGNLHSVELARKTLAEFDAWKADQREVTS